MVQGKCFGSLLGSELSFSDLNSSPFLLLLIYCFSHLFFFLFFFSKQVQVQFIQTYSKKVHKYNNNTELKKEGNQS